MQCCFAMDPLNDSYGRSFGVEIACGPESERNQDMRCTIDGKVMVNPAGLPVGEVIDF